MTRSRVAVNVAEVDLVTRDITRLGGQRFRMYLSDEEVLMQTDELAKCFVGEYRWAWVCGGWKCSERIVVIFEYRQYLMNFNLSPRP